MIEIVGWALAEDIGSGDVTTELCVPADRQAVAHMIARQSLVVAGIELLSEIFAGCEVSVDQPSGSSVEPDTRLATIRGAARALLTRERTALNFVQRLSGVEIGRASCRERV